MNNPSVSMDARGVSDRPAARHDDRNVRLLRRHWDWLEAQPRSADATLRLLVEEASRDQDGRYRKARAKEACYLYMRDMAGDRPHFEEAVRALFADDTATLRRHITSWPIDIQTGIAKLWGATSTGAGAT